ncbi:MAG: NAD+ synthase [Desulfobacteraceae bacterium]|nr:NAD+ synthase [Desulfobacteraceae bacterium]
MKMALIQTNPTVGDFDGNLKAILSWAGRAREAGCGLAIFPELALSGYPPLDLLERPAFIDRQLRAGRELAELALGIDLLCGLITRHTADTGKPLHNSAALISGGQTRLIHKRLLPTYDVFDEARYFEPGAESAALPWQGLHLGVTICEDIFNDPELAGGPLSAGPGRAHDAPLKLYQKNPLADLLAKPARRPDLLVNLAASPFQTGKSAAKIDFFSRLCRRHGLPLLYVNQVGGQDSLLFDGQSLILGPDGRLLARAAAFREDMVIFDTVKAASQPGIVAPPEEAPALIFEALVMGVRDYLGKCGFRSAVLGLSGGIDSALTAVIAAAALGPENVLGVALPSPYTARESVEDARKLAENLGLRFVTIPIAPTFATELATLAPLFAGTPQGIAEQNLQARIRGNLLMALANKFGHLLLSTGNKSELAVGYCTLYGDLSGGLAVISDVPKVMVYRICRHLNRNREIIPARTLARAPTAELALNQRDQDDLPPYEVLDPILAAYLEENRGVAEIVGLGFDEQVVREVVRRVNANEHKRQQAPMGLKVTSKAFGLGRRYPVCQRFREDG